MNDNEFNAGERNAIDRDVERAFERIRRQSTSDVEMSPNKEAIIAELRRAYVFAYRNLKR